MIEPKVKGNFFDRLLVCIKRSTGSAGLDKMGLETDSYVLERWYPYTEFCGLLRRSKEVFPDNQAAHPFRLGYNAMFRDERWKTMFRDQSPKDVFGTNKRQDALFMVGRFLIEKAEDKLVQVRMTLWSNNEDDNALWAEYYQGVVQGVLDMTGTEGAVEMEAVEDGEINYWTYRITW